MGRVRGVAGGARVGCARVWVLGFVGVKYVCVCVCVCARVSVRRAATGDGARGCGCVDDGRSR